MHRWERTGTLLALLVDPELDTARIMRPWLLVEGFELVHARAAFAALELLQRLPQQFGLVLVNLNLPDVTGGVVIETLRHFRPELPVLCITSPDYEDPLGIDPCLATPFTETAFHDRLSWALGGYRSASGALALAPDVIDRAREEFAMSGNLLDAAREIAKG